jgi:hypothetical protein
LATLILAIAPALLGVFVVGAICLRLAKPVVLDAAFAAQVSVYSGYFYAHQPGKMLAYLVDCLVVPPLMAGAFWLARGWVGGLGGASVAWINRLGLLAYVSLLFWCAWALLTCSDPPMKTMPPLFILMPVAVSEPFWTIARVLALGTVAGLGAIFVRARPDRPLARKVLGWLLALWAVLLPTRFYYPALLNHWTIYTYHLNSLLDAESQAVAGHHMLVDYPHIYGGYGEILAPMVRLFPRDLGVLLASLAIPDALGMLGLLLTAWVVVRRPALLFICGLALFCVQYGVATRDIYYGYGTARFFLPPLGLLCATLYFRTGRRRWYVAATMLAAGAPIWNMDSGFVLWGSWAATLALMALAAGRFATVARHFAIQALALAAAWSAFFLYLRFVSGQWPDLGLLFYFQQLVVAQGYFCLRLASPDAWTFVILIYLLGLVLVLRDFAARRAHWLTASTLMISLLGLGLFSYFMGRSVPSNLIVGAYPAILLLGVFCAEGDIGLAAKRLPAITRWFLLPFKLCLFWWAMLFSVQLSDQVRRSADTVVNWTSRAPTPLILNAAFVQQQAHPGEHGVLMLAGHSGLYYYMSGTARELKIPGVVELLRAQDMDRMLDALRTHAVKKLFVEDNFYDVSMYRADIYQSIRDVIAQNYQAAAASPSGDMTLYVPR